MLLVIRFATREEEFSCPQSESAEYRDHDKARANYELVVRDGGAVNPVEKRC